MRRKLAKIVGWLALVEQVLKLGLLLAALMLALFIGWLISVPFTLRDAYRAIKG